MTRSKPRTLALGSYSSGTRRPEDLIPVFLDVAEGLKLSRQDRQTIRVTRQRFTKACDDGPDARAAIGTPAEGNYWDIGADEDCSTLFDLLNSYCPDYCYFGALPGDGADYGVWVVEDLLSDRHQGSYDGFVWRSAESPREHRQHDRALPPDGSTWHTFTKQYPHWLHVNERGNTMLYRRAGQRWVEVWSVV